MAKILLKKDQRIYYRDLIKNPAWRLLKRMKKKCRYCRKAYTFRQYFLSFPVRHYWIQEQIVALGRAFVRGSRCPGCRKK